MSSLLSIVIPVRNMSGKLKNLQSWVSASNLDNLEIIIVEDQDDLATSFELQEILDKVNSPAIKHIKGNFGSPGSSRNAGKNVANGEWLAFWDADDLGYPEYALNEILELSRPPEIDLVVFSFDVRDWNSNRLLSKSNLDMKEMTLDAIIDQPGIWRILFSTQFIKEIEFPNYKMAEDQVFLARVVAQSPRVKFVDQILYSYFRNVPGQLTKSKKAISDLKFSTLDMRAMIAASQQHHFFSELYVRQSLSGMKYGSYKEKVYFGRNIVKFVSDGPFTLKMRIILKVLF